MNRKSEKTKINQKSEQTDRVPTSIREGYKRVNKQKERKNENSDQTDRKKERMRRVYRQKQKREKSQKF